MEADSLQLGMVSRTEQKYDPEGQIVKTQQKLAEVDSLERLKESAKTDVDKDQEEMGIVALRGITTYSGRAAITLNRGITVPSPEKAGETDHEGVLADKKLSKAKAAPAKKAYVNEELRKELSPVAKVPAVPPAVPQPEINTRENCFSTFSLNVSDVSFKLAAASLESGVMPDPGSVRVEEFVNAFNYRDPAPQGSARLAFSWERSRYPFAHNRDMVRFSVQTAVRGREPQKPLNLVLMLDNSGSMERADRTQIIHEALKVLAQQLHTDDRISVVTFARTARLWVDGMHGGKPDEFIAKVGDLNPEGGTNLEEAMDLAYKTATRHFQVNGMNRVILLTDGAANLGNVEPEALKQKVINQRQKGIALDCFGIGWEGYNDDLLEVLSRNGDGRYGFLDQPEQAGPEFAQQLAGALNVAAADVKTQVEFNPNRVTVFRQIGYAKHQLTKEQFRDNTVDAAELAAAESGNALYAIEVNPQGNGPIGVVRVRYKVPATGAYHEQEWTIPYQPAVPSLEQSSPAMRLAVSAAAFGEWLTRSPYASEVTLSPLLSYLGRVPETFAPDTRPQRLIGMIRQAQAINGK
jgi:Mg-chelatase subunit ChlD